MASALGQTLRQIIVCVQAPWYNSNTAHQGEVDDMRDDLEPFLYQHGVDIVFAGT